jgi:hypothetical protein
VNTTNAAISAYSGSDPKLQGSTIATLAKTWQGIIVFNQIRPDDPANAALGAYLDGTGIVANPVTNSFTRVQQFLDLDNLTFVLTQAPNKKMAFTTDLTFTGTPPKGPVARLRHRLQSR